MLLMNGLFMNFIIFMYLFICFCKVKYKFFLFCNSDIVFILLNFVLIYFFIFLELVIFFKWGIVEESEFIIEVYFVCCVELCSRILLLKFLFIFFLRICVVFILLWRFLLNMLWGFDNLFFIFFRLVFI